MSVVTMRFFRPLASIILVLASLFTISTVATGTATASKFFEDVCTSDTGTAAACSADGQDKISGPNGLLSRVTNLLALVTGIVAVGMIIYAGFTFITSGGDSSKVEQARKTIIYSVVGLVIIVIARGLILFVISRV